jgi:hypothetical protein
MQEPTKDIIHLELIADPIQPASLLARLSAAVHFSLPYTLVVQENLFPL